MITDSMQATTVNEGLELHAAFTSANLELFLPGNLALETQLRGLDDFLLSASLHTALHDLSDNPQIGTYIVLKWQCNSTPCDKINI